MKNIRSPNSARMPSAFCLLWSKQLRMLYRYSL